MSSIPSAERASPSPATRLAPNRSAKRGALRANGMSVTGSGASAQAARSGERSATYWRYWRMMKKKPKLAKNCTVMVRLPMPKPARRNRRGSSSGSVRRSSQATKATAPTTPVTKAVTVRVSDHPRLGPSMKP